MQTDILSKQILTVFGVIALMLIAGCFGAPPSPPDTNQTTPRPDAEPYVQDGSDLTFQKVQQDHESLLLNEAKGFSVEYTVTIQDPRTEAQTQKFTKAYRVNTERNEYLYNSTFTGQSVQAYKNSVLYYEKSNGNLTVVPAEEATNTPIDMEEATANSSLIRVGMNSIDYSLSNTSYSGTNEISKYSRTQSVSNYALGDVVPDDLAYEFGDPQVTGERVKSTVVMQKRGLLMRYTFEYTATIFVGGSEEQYKMTISYIFKDGGPHVTVDKPGWTADKNNSP